MFWTHFTLLMVVISTKLCNGLNITILHTNDVHCRFLSFNSQNRVCTKKDFDKNECWGGAARRQTVINKLKSQQKNVLLLNAGDEFQGTVWFTVFKWQPIAQYMNLMKYDAITFGNHEFDLYLEELANFMGNVTTPFVNSNIDAKGSILENKYKPNMEFNFEGETIGVIGYTSVQTPDISKPWMKDAPGVPVIKFNDEVESLKKAVATLQAKGINKIIALGHSGINMDRRICKEVKGVDLVIGGHTNTFLYTGTPPSTEKPEGVYPEVYTQTGDNCLVVQEYAYGKYLGFLQVDFDANGVIRNWNGNPILIDQTIAEEQTIKDLLAPYAQRLETVEKTIVGMSAVPMNSMMMTCKRFECTMGNMVTDAFLYQYLKNHWQSPRVNGSGWTPSAIAFMNSGGLREFQIGSMTNMTMSDFNTILPFSDTVQKIRIKGKFLREALEHSVQDFYEDDTHGKFLQVSGIKIVYDLSKPNGRRIASVLVRCAECETPMYEDLQDDKIYSVVTNSYVIEGGNGYYMLTKNLIDTDSSDILDIDVVVDYFRHYQPVVAEIEGRISFVTDDPYKKYCTQSSSANLVPWSFALISVCILSRLF